jgi:aminoglycoside phosphotransferase (APT) family kinase protein
VTRSATALAALASAAVRGLSPIRVVSPPDYAGGEYDVAFVDDDRGMRWVVRAPRRTAAALSLEAEARVLAELRRRLPVAVPEPAGFIALPEGGRAVIYPYVEGDQLHGGELTAGSPLAVEVGRVIAALHEIPPGVFDEAGVPSYTADEYRLRRMAELDHAARRGDLPAVLLARWERALEDVSLWRFAATPIHGDLAAEHVLVERGDRRGPLHARVSGLIDWGEACVADPADDLAWVVLTADPGAFDTVLESYVMGRREQPDRHLAQRARLAGELALVRWLNAGLAADDLGIVDDAHVAMRDLAERIPLDDPLRD